MKAPCATLAVPIAMNATKRDAPNVEQAMAWTLLKLVKLAVPAAQHARALRYAQPAKLTMAWTVTHVQLAQL